MEWQRGLKKKKMDNKLNIGDDDYEFEFCLWILLVQIMFVERY